MSILDQFAQLAPIFSLIAIIAAIIFGIVQLKQFRMQRKDLAAVEVMKTMQDVAFTDSVIAVNKLKKGISLKSLRKLDIDYEQAVLILGTKFETLGFLAFKKIIPIDFVENLVGGECIRHWNKLSHYVSDFRNESNQPLLFEWFEWLAYQLHQRQRHTSKTALEKYKNWKA